MIERVLIAGHGNVGRRHLRIVREALPEADIRVLRHQHSVDTPEFANGSFNRLEESGAFAPQVAVVANAAPFHVEAALALADAGTHLLIEKPLSNRVGGVRALLRRVRERNLTLQVGYNLRYLPSLGVFRDRIHAGSIGRVVSVRCEVGQYLPSWRPNADYRQSVSARRALGGGVLLELSHEVDYLRWIFGDVAWVSAWSGRQSSLEIDVEDTGHLTLGFAPDPSGRGPVAALSLDFIRHDTTRLCTAIGDQGSLRWNGITGEVKEWRAGSAAWLVVFRDARQRDHSYRAQWMDFLACVRTGQAPRVTGEDGLAVLGIVEAARHSASAHGTRIATSSCVEQDRP